MPAPHRRATPDELIERVAARQHGVLHRRQAFDAGLSRGRIRTNLDAGRWRSVAPSVYAYPGHADTWERRLWIAHLHAGPDSVVSHGSAGRLGGLSPIEGFPVELIVGRGQTDALPFTRRHRLDDLAPDHVMRVDGLPVTVPARTIVDLAPFVSRVRLSSIIEDAEVEGRCPLVDVATMLDSLRRCGKPGVRVLCDVLDEIGPGEALSRSELERLLDEVIELSGLPAPEREYPLPTDTDLSGFVDRCWPEAGLIVEADGRRWHTRRAHIAMDHERDLQASRLGFLTQRLIWERLRGRPADTAAALVDIYEQRVGA